MNAGGVFFLVLFILLIVGGSIYGAYLYRKDRQCFKINLARCKVCTKNNWTKCKNFKKKKEISPGDDSDVSALVGQKSQIHPG